MSIKEDRESLVVCLGGKLPKYGVSVSGYAPLTVTENLAFLELKNIEPDSVFGSLKLTWALTITSSPKMKVNDQQAMLDIFADVAIAGITADKAANIESVEEYFALQEASNGAVFPAVRLILTSFTNIKE